MTARSADEVIALIYEAAFDGELWPMVMAEVAERVGAEHVFLGVHNVATGATSIAPRTDPEHLRAYNEHFVNKNPCVPAMMAAPVGRLFHTPGEVTDGEAYRRSEIFHEWCRPGNMGYGAMCVALNKSARQSAFTSVYKPWGIDSFDHDERNIYARLVRHLSQAVELQQRIFDLRTERDAALVALDTMDDGILVTDAAGSILHAGGAAGEILDRSGWVAEAGAEFAPPGHEVELRRLLASCVARNAVTRAGGRLRIPRDGRSDLELTVMPYPANRRSELWLGASAQPAATIILVDTDLRIERARDRLSLIYGLTPAEIRFTTEIAKGDGKRRAAERCGISYATARAHLSNIFAKTGVHRQAELVRLLLGG